MASIPSFLIGLDLGERRDYTALSVLQEHIIPGSAVDLQQRRRDGEFTYGRSRLATLEPTSVHQYRYDLIQLDRWRGEGYKAIVPKLNEVLTRLRHFGFEQQRQADVYMPSEPSVEVLIDETGVGVAVVEEIRSAGIDCKGITITGGDAISNQGDEWRVPKRELVTRTQVVMETDRLKIASALPLAQTLVAEFGNFKIKKIALTGNDTYGAGADWRDGNHDDLVLSVAMALWWGEHNATAGDLSDLDEYYDRFVPGGRVA